MANMKKTEKQPAEAARDKLRKAEAMVVVACSQRLRCPRPPVLMLM